MKKYAANFPVDIVYLWVNGSDPEWLAKKNAFLGKTAFRKDVNCKGRFADNDELKFSLRSLEKYAPWIRKIFIVTDNQVPDWLDITNQKIQMVDHTEILPKEAQPCYNSVIIEHFLYKIPDLSEHFLYANDDMFFNAAVAPEDFFAADGYPIVRLRPYPFARLRYFAKKIVGKKLSTYRKTILISGDLVKKKFGKRYWGMPHHNIDAYCKNDYRDVVETVFADEIGATITHHTRSRNDIMRVIFLYYALAVGHGHLRPIKRRESCVVRIQRRNYQHYFDKYHPKLVCMEDSERASDNDRERTKLFLQNLFPVPSAFEKPATIRLA
ncbi:MAG: Stealth CR1 domain-containing protein [Candidatus Symbiothrix sp.]|jgi:hypothetical protein|nr:Stealth CR1 domain-containing protein [Candidatus Symbiothrix sp.]